MFLDSRSCYARFVNAPPLAHRSPGPFGPEGPMGPCARPEGSGPRVHEDIHHNIHGENQTSKSTANLRKRVSLNYRVYMELIAVGDQEKENTLQERIFPLQTNHVQPSTLPRSSERSTSFAVAVSSLGISAEKQYLNRDLGQQCPAKQSRKTGKRSICLRDICPTRTERERERESFRNFMRVFLSLFLCSCGLGVS